MIEFKLKDIELIEPFGSKGKFSLHWFGLSDGELHFKFGDNSVYEYSEEALKFWQSKESKYVDYYISRFAEDFMEIYSNIIVDIPDNLFSKTSNLDTYFTDLEIWRDSNDSEEIEISDRIWDKYENLKSWVSNRQLDSGHLKGGPKIWFFRNGNIIRIVWKSDSIISDSIQQWKTTKGIHELSFNEFKSQINKFYANFIESMSLQIQKAQNFDFGEISVDRQLLKEEQVKRKREFSEYFENSVELATDWKPIIQMHDEIKTKG